MHDGAIEATAIPRNPLDVLAQQLVAMTVMDRWTVADLLATVTRASPYETLTRDLLEGVLGMLAGAYPSDEFAELKPRVVWDRVTDVVEGRRDARVVAVTSGGTIPDRGLYGVFMVGEAGTPGRRVGELDEEMVYELRAGMHGDVIVLGASSWRVDEISHDRVTVTPAPGVPGKLPFWKGDAVGRPIELGRAMGAFVGELEADLAKGDRGRRAAAARLREEHDLDERAADNLLAYLEDEREATGSLPTDKRIVLERFRDELGDWRLTLLTPFGGRVHAPWSMAIESRLAERLGLEVQTIWSDDGIAIRLPEGDAPLDGIEALLFPEADEIEDLVVGQVASSSLFASRFRENAARALLLPRRRPGTRTPLWQQRQRAADLLAVASRYGSFPILVETYRECLSDVFDLPALREVLAGVARREIAVHSVETLPCEPVREQPAVRLRRRVHVRRRHAARRAPRRRPDARPRPPARTARAGGAARAARPRRPRRPRAVAPGAHRRPARDDRRRRPRPPATTRRPARRRARGPGGGRRRRRRSVARRARRRSSSGPDPDRRRGALDRDRGRGALPGRGRGVGAGRRAGGVPRARERRARRPAGSLGPIHGPFLTPEPARRWGLPVGIVEDALERLLAAGTLLRGEFRPGGAEREWCDPDVLRLLRRRSLARLRREVEPVDPAALGRFLPDWHGIAPVGSAPTPFRGTAALERLAEVVDQLAGLPIPASVLERDVLPARVPGYQPRLLDELGSLGEVAWVGRGSLGRDDGRIALVRPGRDAVRPVGPAGGGRAAERAAPRRDPRAPRSPRRVVLPRAARGGRRRPRPRRARRPLGPRLGRRGHQRHLRAACGRSAGSGRGVATRRPRPGRLTALGPPEAAGRWSLVEPPAAISATERLHAQALAMLERHGVLTREAVASEGLDGGFSAVYPVLRALEDAGRIRRGYFVDGLGAAQFALSGALDRLRATRDPAVVNGGRTIHLLAAADPAQPYGAALAWPRRGETDRRPLQRAAGAYVVLVDGVAALYLERGGATLQTLPAADDPEIGASPRARARRPARRRARPRTRHQEGRRPARGRVAVPRALLAGRLRRRLSRPRAAWRPCLRATRSFGPRPACGRTSSGGP